MLKNKSILENRRLRREIAFNQFLHELKNILPKNIQIKCFISYAWEDNSTPAGKAKNDKCQNRLTRIKNDLGILGVDVFFDLYDMHGAMKLRMEQSLASSHFVFLIGTPRLVERLNSVPLTNAAFEYQHIKNKLLLDKDCLLPLCFEGDFGKAFPSEVCCNLIRDMRDEDSYEMMMAGLSNPMGIIPNIFGIHNLNANDTIKLLYKIAWEKLATALQLIDIEIKPRSEVDAKIVIPYHDIRFKDGAAVSTQQVYCQGTWHGHDVTIKTLPIPSEDMKQELIREAQIMGQLYHPNLRPFYGVCLDPNHECLLYKPMESDLSTFLQENPFLTLLEQKTLILNLLNGISYLHSRNIIHRHLKPASVLFSEGRLYISDLGFAKVQFSDSVSSIHQLPEINVAQAPELFLSQDVTEKIDIYSLGWILWHILTGKPWPNTHSLALKKQYPNLDDVPSQCRALVEQCWCDNPKARPTIMQLLQQFEAVQHDNPAALDNLLREGQVHESASRYPLAREIYLIAARQEHIKSAYSLALLYLNSYIPMNQHEMLHYLTKASEQYYRAQYNLARIYERGEFVTKDISRAIVLYQAVVNNPQSMPDLITGARKKVESLSVLVSTDNTRVLQNLTLKK